MKVLVVGSGGREHALAWKLAADPEVTSVYAIPGNPGIAQVAECIPGVPASPKELLTIVSHLAVDLTVIGPEVPLVAGVVDEFRTAQHPIVGPTRECARLEGSKTFAKHFFKRLKIPTAIFETTKNLQEAQAVLDRSAYPVVVKADGLAAGKGVVIARDRAEADQAIDTLGDRLVIEEYLTGEEVSFIVLSDGRDVIELEPCQDHKAIFDGDRGPNTGGMGAYCDSRILTASEREKIMNTIIRPTIEATGFTGFLYAGLMMTAGGPKLLEYNVRLGDPEAQVIVHRMVADFGQVLMASAQGQLRNLKIGWRPEPSVCVVLASAGYPNATQPGAPIRGIERAEATGASVFHAGTRIGRPTGFETAGGRVLGVTARGADLQTAIINTYGAVSQVSFPGRHFRTDIGKKGLSRWPRSPLQ